MPKIVNIALDLPKNSRGSNYLKMTFDEQLKFLTAAIRKAYGIVKDKDPTATIVVVLRENCIINNKSFLHRILSPQQNEGFKSECKALTDELKNLYIVGGSVSHYKTFDKIKNHKDKANQIVDGYAKFNFVAELESKREFNTLENTEFYKHFQRLKKNFKGYEVKIESVNYNFFNGEIIAKRKKVAPFYELPEDTKVGNDPIRFIYAFNSNFAVFNIEVQTKTKLLSFPCIVEICKEGALGVANYLLKKGELIPPYFRFILSDSIDPIDIVEPKLAKFTMHVDSDPASSITVFANDTGSNNDFSDADSTDNDLQEELQIEFLRLDPFGDSHDFLTPIPLTQLNKHSPSIHSN